MSGLRVAIVGCGLIGAKRAAALRPEDSLLACFDVIHSSAKTLARGHGARATATFDELLAANADVVVVATSHDELAAATRRAMEAGSHVLVEKPAGLGSGDVRMLLDVAARTGRLVKVGFNHRFHPAIARAAAEVHSGEHGPLLHLRAHYGHGGRPGYDREWRAQPTRSGGGELIDQGMHLLDLTHWIAGPLTLHSALLRTHFWNTPVDDNAALLLGADDDRRAPWAMLHVSWTEWKNTFSLEIYCRSAKLEVQGLVRSYGPQLLRIYRMRPELGPPDVDEFEYPHDDVSWEQEWRHFANAIAHRETVLLGTLDDALYAWETVEQAYASSPYAPMRALVRT